MFVCLFILLVCVVAASSNNVTFFDQSHLYNFLISDPDNYYKSFTKQDLLVRKIGNVGEYHKAIEKSVGEFTLAQKEILVKCARIADQFFRGFERPWFHGIKASKVTWIFGCIHGFLYEEGLPHTRLNVILLPSNFQEQGLVDLLIHEKVHVYQKLYPLDVEKYFTGNRLKIVGKRTVNDNIRANPDANADIYGANGKVYALEYNAQPNSIGDTRGDEDHPNEKMAYEIAGLYSVVG